VGKRREHRTVVHGDDMPAGGRLFDPVGNAHGPAVSDWFVIPIAVRVEFIFILGCPEIDAVVGVVAGDQIAQPQFFPFGDKYLAAVEGEFKPPGLHDHFHAHAQFFNLMDDLVDRGEVIEVELVKARRLFAAAPGRARECAAG
jgi:hypothetical protein